MEKMPVTIDGASGEVEATPRKIRLKTLEDIRMELASVYRDTRSGKLEASEGTKLAYLLTSLAKIIEGSVIEQRIEVLEHVLKDRNSK